MKRSVLNHTVVVSSALRRLLLDHQIFCSADCCKARAFQFTENSIARWVDFEHILRTEEMVAEIRRIGAALQDVSGQIILDARGLQSEWDSGAFRAFWNRFEATFLRALDSRQRADETADAH
jgi:hypothetical protein